MKRIQFFAALTMVSLLITLIAKGQYTGIGTTSPQSRFHLNGTAWFQGDNTPLSPNAGAGIGIGFGAGGTGGYIFAWSYANNTPRNIWLNHTGGSVIIGSTSSFPNARLEIAGNGARAIYSSTTSGEALYGYSTGGTGIWGRSATTLGVYALSDAGAGTGLLADGKFIGAQANASGADVNRQAIRGEISNSGGGYAGIFINGFTGVFGTLTKTAGAFLIDHPVEPETKYLYHSFVESPDMKNIYDGVITTGTDGTAVVNMPDWFEALNMDFRYQLTCMGQFAQAIVLDEISNNQFTIKTDKPNVKVSWQLTGIRNDPYAHDHRIPVEKLKRPDEVGKYIYPEGFGKSQQYLLDILKPTNINITAAPKPADK